MVVVVVVVLGCIIFGFWREMRRRSEELLRAQQALNTASTEVTTMKQALHDAAGKLTTALLIADSSPEFKSIATSLTGAQQLLREAQGIETPDVPQSAAEIFRRVAESHQHTGVEITIEQDTVAGPAFIGRSAWVERIALNVFSNAVREAKTCEKSEVHLRLTDHEIVVTNPTRDATVAREAIRARVSAHGSSGFGLQIVLKFATQVGWSVSFDVDQTLSDVTTRIHPLGHATPNSLPS